MQQEPRGHGPRQVAQRLASQRLERDSAAAGVLRVAVARRFGRVFCGIPGAGFQQPGEPPDVNRVRSATNSRPRRRAADRRSGVRGGLHRDVLGPAPRRRVPARRLRRLRPDQRRSAAGATGRAPGQPRAERPRGKWRRNRPATPQPAPDRGRARLAARHRLARPADHVAGAARAHGLLESVDGAQRLRLMGLRHPRPGRAAKSSASRSTIAAERLRAVPPRSICWPSWRPIWRAPGGSARRFARSRSGARPRALGHRCWKPQPAASPAAEVAGTAAIDPTARRVRPEQGGSPPRLASRGWRVTRRAWRKPSTSS